GSAVDAVAFGLRGAMMAARALYGERLRLDWELIFEEGHITRDSLNAFVSRIFDATEALHLTDAQKLQIGAATEQLWSNYQHVAEKPWESYRGIHGSVQEARTRVAEIETRVQEAKTQSEKDAATKALKEAVDAEKDAEKEAKAQKFNVIMAKIGEYQITV